VPCNGAAFPTVKTVPGNSVKKLADLIRFDLIDESKIDVNEPITEQLLSQSGKIQTPRFPKVVKNPQPEFSVIDHNQRLVEQGGSADVLSQPLWPKQRLKKTVEKKKNEDDGQVSVLDYLSRLGGSVAPMDGFPHTLLQMRHAKRAKYVQQIDGQSYKAISFCKLEFVYDESFYWIVKVKRLWASGGEENEGSVLYQMKFVRTIPAVAMASLNSSFAKESCSGSVRV
jgi:hypothetical protein